MLNHRFVAYLKRIVCSFLFIYLVFVAAKGVNAATIWCNPANSGQADGATKSTGYKTLWGALNLMKSGDEIIIANGDWSVGYSEMSIDSNGHLPPSGTSYASLTTIRAETDWGVKIPRLNDLGVGVQYVKLQGIVFIGADNSAVYWHHCEFIRCGFFSPKVTGNSATFGIAYGTYNLVEECIAWGGGRYKFLDYHGEYNIYRRCVARHDWYVSPEWAGQESNFRGYGTKNSVWQNCISIDSDREQYQTVQSKEDADFWIGDQSGSGGNVIIGSIVVKGMYNAYYLSGPELALTDVALSNSVALGPGLVGDQYLTGAISYGAIAATVNNCLFLGFNNSYQHFASHNKTMGSLSITNSAIKNVGSLWAAAAADYNYYYNVGSGNYGPHSVNTDPAAKGLLYPVRVESGSVLSTAGASSGVVGPTILKKLGVSGTHKEQSGWDTTTDDNLWPFPNEAKIKELMSTTVGGVSGIYGFTSGNSKDGSPQTLTKYIWEFLGNQIPSTIYSSGPPEIKTIISK